MKSKALEVQVGGDHYKKLPIQPAQFGMANHLDPCAFSILKYVTRHRDKNGKQDLLKALHFVDLRTELVSSGHIVTFWKITPEEYCLGNSLPPLESEVIFTLCSWVESDQNRHEKTLKSLINQLIATYDSTGE